MMANEERLALILEANDKATAVLQKVRKEIEDTSNAAGKGGKSVRGLGDETDRLSDTKLLKGARAMGSIAHAAEAAKFGTREMSRAAGELAETLALASGNAKFAGWAIMLNAAVVAGGALVSVLQQAMYAQAPTEDQIKRIGKLTKDRADQQLAGIDKVHNAALKAMETERSNWDLLWNGTGKKDFVHNLVDVTGLSSAARREAERTGKLKELIVGQDVDKSAAENIRLIALGDQTRELVKQRDIGNALGDVQLRAVHHQASSLELSRAEALAAKRNADLQTEAMFRHRDEDGKLHVLTAAELKMRSELLGVNERAFGDAVKLAKAKYDEQIKETAFNQDQSAWYARRRLAQSDYQTSLDAIRQQNEQQIHAIQISEKLEEDKTAEISRATDLYSLQLQLLEQQHELQTRMLRAQNNVDASGSSLIGPGNLVEQHNAKLAFIEEERLAAIKRGEDETEANRKAYNDRRALIRSEIDQTRQGYKTIEDALLSSHSRQLKAIGYAMQAFRRLEIGAEASMAAVESARAFGKVPGYLAAGQIGAAALSAASGVQLAAAAALGFREALGGGGGGASGGGSGSASSGVGTFEPRSSGTGNGGTTINLYQKDPFGRDQIKQTLFFLQRAGVTKTAAAEITPSSGLVGRAA